MGDDEQLRADMADLNTKMSALMVELGRTQERLEIFTALFNEERITAASYRQDLRIAVGAQSDSVRTLNAKVDTLAERVDSVAATVKIHDTAYLQGQGIAYVGKYVWIGITAIVGALFGLGLVIWTLASEIIKMIKPH